MINKFLICTLIILGYSLILLIGCKKVDPIELPSLTTLSVSEITLFSAKSGGNITNDGGANIIARGLVWSTTVSPTLEQNSGKTREGSEIGVFTSNLIFLTPNTVYYFRAYATNIKGTGYGNELSFSTPANLPADYTNLITNITTSSATCGGNVTSDGGATVTVKGVCWSSRMEATISDNKTNDGTGIGVFTSNLTGLTAHTIYSVQAYATNSTGTNYGGREEFITLNDARNDIVFNPNLSYGSLPDVDGNIYKTIQIESQIWMAENLKTTKYNNGSPITLLKGTTILDTPGYNWYKNNIINKTCYGALYNWYAVNTGNLCPKGWHVPTDAEWTILAIYLGGANVTGGKIKEIDTNHWYGPNTGATNETGFTALPGGFGFGNDGFDYIESSGVWWASSEISSSSAESRNLFYRSNELNSGSADKWYEFSVRCLRDE